MRPIQHPTSVPASTSAPSSKARGFGDLLSERSRVPLQRMIERDKGRMRPVLEEFCRVWEQVLQKAQRGEDADRWFGRMEDLCDRLREVGQNCYFNGIWNGDIIHAVAHTAEHLAAYADNQKIPLFDVFAVRDLTTTKKEKLQALNRKPKRFYPRREAERIWHGLFGSDRPYGVLRVSDFFEIFDERVQEPKTLAPVSFFGRYLVEPVPRVLVVGVGEIVASIADLILKNALFALKERYGEDGRGEPKDGSISATATRLSGNSLQFVVSDNGTGIRPEHLPRVFEPGFSTKGRKGGGMGLSACKELIEMLGGTIRVESEWGKGATVTFIIPKEFVETEGHTPNP